MKTILQCTDKEEGKMAILQCTDKEEKGDEDYFTVH